MLLIENHLTLDKKTITASNLCDRFSLEDLQAIGSFVYECYETDLKSREHWERRTEAAMNLAMQIQEEKNFPWPGCANIAFPLVTIASLQFHSRAYPALVNGRNIVQCRVIGDDPDGILTARADKISKHMSWQLLEQDDGWESETDRSLISVPIVGTAFKKTYHDPRKGHNVSELVLAKDLVVNYWAKSLESCPTKTHIIPLFRNDIYERVMAGIYRDILEEEWYKQDASVERTPRMEEENNRAGLETPQINQNTPFTFLEQHCVLDLDGDGYAEPYIVTIERSSRSVVRIVCRFDREEDIIRNDDKDIVRIDAMEYFTKIPFIPSPDGGIMDVGFGVLLGPLNESVNSAINQLFDAGTLSNTAGGFLGRGAKIRGGVYSFSPFEWNRVDATGDDLRKNIMPLPVREPSNVMFQLLSLLIDYTNRISGATDMLTGINPGQNTPAETARTMVEQGQKVYSAIFKRIWRSMKSEFKKLYQLNSIYLPTRESFGGPNQYIAREDYTALPSSLVPAADPNIISDAAKFSQANLLVQRAAESRGYDPDQVERYYLRAIGIDSADLLYPGIEQAGPPPEDPKIQIQKMKMQVEMARLQDSKMQFIMDLTEQRRMNTAKIIEMSAKATALMENIHDKKVQQRISAFQAAISAMKEDNNKLAMQVDKLIEGMQNDAADDNGGRGVSGVEKSSSNPANDGVGSESAGGTEGDLG